MVTPTVDQPPIGSLPSALPRLGHRISSVVQRWGYLQQREGNDADRGLVGGLIADPHCNATHPVEPFCDPSDQELCSLIQAIQAAARIESGMIEKVLPMDGRPGASGCGVTREWADPSSRTTRASNWTTGPVGPDGHP